MTTFHLRACAICFVSVGLTILAGCDSSTRITVAKGESAAAAIDRVAKTLPLDQAEIFRTAAEGLAFHYALRPAPDRISKSGPTRAIHGKTPSQIISEYNALSPEAKKEVAEVLASMKAREKSAN